jgi:hypothetical protein
MFSNALQGYYQVPLDEESSFLMTFFIAIGKISIFKSPDGDEEFK